jgi:hypothetical protein
MSKRSYRVLLSEGQEDLRVIPELVEANGIAWEEYPDNRNRYLVNIKLLNGKNTLEPKTFQKYFNDSELTALGLILDADESTASTWQSIRDKCLQVRSLKNINFPLAIPSAGFITEIDESRKFGVWIMPDNQSPGMLETFLAYLVPDHQNDLWLYAQEAAHRAKEYDATFIESHTDKAHVYTWLAWQEPPGRQLHDAIKQKIQPLPRTIGTT